MVNILHLLSLPTSRNQVSILKIINYILSYYFFAEVYCVVVQNALLTITLVVYFGWLF